MTVLMFGWEFPPHISGGLGTACFGMTNALIAEKIRIIFVVPKAHGDEVIPLINASEVFVDNEDHAELSHRQGEGGTEFTTIQVPAVLTPYGINAPGVAVEQWSWEYPASNVQMITKGDQVRYEFSGTYGPLLMEEVARYAVVAAKIASTNSFDVIHAHDWLTYPAGISAKEVSGKPLIVHVHATEFDRSASGSINQIIFDIEKRGMEASDLVIAVSQWTKDIIVERYGINAEKVKVVHNGVIQDQSFDLDNPPSISAQFVTFLGRITFQKGPGHFIEAARKVLDYLPDTHFIMAGSGDMLPGMLDRVAQLKLSSRIHFTGFLKSQQMKKVWSLTDVYVMPSVSEPFGITPLEAIQAGVPVIVSNQSGVSEVLDHAIKIDFWDTNALADSIINVLRHKGLSHSLRENSRKEIGRLTWKSAARRIKTIYHEL